ncbi:hypothetical protein FACS1894137_18530 [Spirochaetia bacterium]|nr:hypothetical protein FACS1894137_18530 [Spirochaetia bacterium]
MENKNLSCKNREVAIAVLETLAGTTPGGTQRDSLIAVKDWIIENFDAYIAPEEVQKRLDRIYNAAAAESKKIVPKLIQKRTAKKDGTDERVHR